MGIRQDNVDALISRNKNVRHLMACLSKTYSLPIHMDWSGQCRCSNLKKTKMSAILWLI